ncbi:non-hydrolyzing UDP-N-acetylglucosamine 2-epimerase [Natronomonas gomsonensis]|uniref:non-hydrolyzing UDP-N-acetylglucosamine 2-epimerase n=1 Tax=Natronomonas gomsonensis TaxID=1046043 RepID=UPI0015C13DDC|nr:UDP-N-acetylglucosamine 2-epimerase (non-hydrolyzing) [Natronomonas gomsonensis]
MATEPPSLAFVFGTRPEIIKCAPLIREAERRGMPFTLVHTGQHYSRELDGVFFEGLGLPVPDYELRVGSDTPGRQTGAMVSELDPVVAEVAPDVVVVHGDTNSTLAGAITTCKLDPELAHVEAGLRSFDRSMPEEHNRVLTDHAADYLFAPTERARRQLAEEGIEAGVWVTGNTVVDAVRQHVDIAARDSDVLDRLGLADRGFLLLTTHRAENVDDETRFRNVLEGVATAAADNDLDCVFPAHPRSVGRIREFHIDVPAPIRVVEPEDFLSFLLLEDRAAAVVTDSGGVQEEAAVLGTPCVTVRDNTERQETVEIGANRLAGTDPDAIVQSVAEALSAPTDWEAPYGDGHAAERILDVLQEVDDGDD